MEFDKLIKKRASIRKFSTKKVSPEDIMDAIVAANLAPSPGNLAMAYFIVIDDPKKIEKIAELSQQEFIKDAKFIVAICTDPKKSKIMFEERSERYIKHHAGALIENFLLKITELGLATCWVEAFSDNLIKETLKIPDNVEVEAIFPIGYEFIKDKTKQKIKLNLDGRVFFNDWGNKFFKKFPSIPSMNNL